MQNLNPGFIFISAIVLVVVVIYTFIALRKQVKETRNKRMDQLKIKYDKGEITKKEYEAKKKDLR